MGPSKAGFPLLARIRRKQRGADPRPNLASSLRRFAVIERDNQAGPDATIKRVASFSIAGVTFQPDAAAPAFPLLAKTLDRDLIAQGDYDAGVILEKLEGMAFLADGRVIVVNDNDGVDGSNGETRIFDLGQLYARPLR